MTPSEHRSTPTLSTLIGAQLSGLFFVSQSSCRHGEGFVYLNLFYKVSLFQPHLTPRHSLLPKVSKASSAKLPCTCFPDSKQGPVIAKMVLHPHPRGWCQGFLSYTRDQKSRVSTRGGNYFANEKESRWPLYIFAKERARLNSSRRKDIPVHSGAASGAEQPTSPAPQSEVP